MTKPIYGFWDNLFLFYTWTMRYQDKRAQESYTLAQQYRATASECSDETRKSLLDITQNYENAAKIYEETALIERDNQRKKSRLIIKGLRILGIGLN